MHSAVPIRAACLLGTLISGCARVSPLPLPTIPPLAHSLADLQTEGVDVAAPLSVADIAVLAVRNSPDLAAGRAQRGVSQAQVLQAGILPNPVVSASISPLLAGNATNNPPPLGSVTNAYGLSITYDIRSLITRASRRREAKFNARALDASLLWQEWQTIAAARLLAVDIIEGDRLLAVLRRARGLLQERADASSVALARGDVTLATAAPDLAALQQADGAALDQERVQLARRHQLNALLGLAPDVPLSLVEAPDLPLIDPAAIRQDLASLPDRRPDLAALRFGYVAEDARLRTAILTQFPNISFGLANSSDNSNIRNLGPQLSTELPIFDRNQGGIALERATRVQLHAEYAARLAAVVGQVGASLAEVALLERQLATLRGSLAPLRADASAARTAETSSDIDERTALDLLVAPVTREQEIVILEQTLAEQLVAIATLTGAGLPPLHITEGGA